MPYPGELSGSEMNGAHAGGVHALPVVLKLSRRAIMPKLK